MLLLELTTSHLRRSQRNLLTGHQGACKGILLRSLAYDIEVQYVPGLTQHLADMMSRSYLPTQCQDTYSEFELVSAVQFLLM